MWPCYLKMFIGRYLTVLWPRYGVKEFHATRTWSESIGRLCSEINMTQNVHILSHATTY